MTLWNPRRFGRTRRHYPVQATARIATAAIGVFILTLLLMQSRASHAQQGTSHQGATNAGVHKIVPKSGVWFGKFVGDKPFYFEVKNGVVSGTAGISYYISCGGYQKSETDYAVDLSKIGGRPGHFKTLVPLRYPNPNSFVAVLSRGDSDDNVKIKITLKGSFTSADSASGTVTVKRLTLR